MQLRDNMGSQSAGRLRTFQVNTVTLTCPASGATFQRVPGVRRRVTPSPACSRVALGGTMKKAFIIVVLISAVCWAQTPPPPPPGSQVAAPQPSQLASTNLVQRVQAPTYSDIYCSGFMTKKQPSESSFVVGGYNSPHTTHWATHDFIYLSGSGYQEGQQLSVVRKLRNPEKFEMFKGQYKLMASAGQPYQDMGRIRIIAIRGSYAVAQIEFSCDTIVPGDIAVPYEERAVVPFRGNT